MFSNHTYFHAENAWQNHGITENVTAFLKIRSSRKYCGQANYFSLRIISEPYTHHK